MTRITRTSALTARHKDLGGKFEEYIRMGVPMTYNTNPLDEHDAVRETAGMYDFTAFLKYRVKGPDAAAVLNHAMTYDITKVKPGQSKYGPFLRETGVICDDGITFNLGNDEYMVVHGDGCAMTMAELSAEGKNATVEYEGGKPKRITDVVIASQHTESALDKSGKNMSDDARKEIVDVVVRPVLKGYLDKNTKFLEDASHKEAPWKKTALLESIPYTLAVQDPDCFVNEKEIGLLLKIVS